MGKFVEKRMENQFKRQRREKGYADCDVWEMRTWFVNTARPILMEMSEKVDNHPDELEFEQWRETIKRMAHLLALMDIWDDSTLRKELNINEDDNHINSFLHDFVSKKKIIIVTNQKPDEFKAEQKLKCDRSRIVYCKVNYGNNGEVVKQIFNTINSMSD